MTMVDGEILVDRFALTRLDGLDIADEARRRAAELSARAAI
jgi:hypothetical protein